MRNFTICTPRKTLSGSSNQGIAGHVERTGRKFSYKVVRKSERGVSLRGLGCMWEDNVKMDRKEMGQGVDQIHLTLDRDLWLAPVYTVMSLQVP